MEKPLISKLSIQKKIGIGLIFLFAFSPFTKVTTGSIEVVNDSEYYDYEEENRYSEPVLVDFKEIRARGTIRMITRYNSSSYFMHRGIDRGFEYELVNRFARQHGLKLAVVLIRPDEDPIEMLNRGDGDLIAENFAVTPKHKSYVAFSKPYNLVDQVLVVKDTHTAIEDIAELEDIAITVRKYSSYYNTLRSLQQAGYHNIKIEAVGEDWNTEALMFEVANGRIDATIADENLYQVASRYIDGITSGLVISENDTIAWATRKNAPELKQKMDDFLVDHFRINESDGRIMRSAYLNYLRRRYYEDDRQVQRFRDRSYDTIYSGYISPYDDMVKRIAGEAGVDWKLVLAVMAHESAFNPNARSWAGALGLMQIMPRFSLVKNEDQLYDPETNIREGVRYIRKHLDRYAHLDSLNRHSFTLGSYNVGMGHIADAQHLAAQLGRDPEEWENVADALLKLMHRKYYQHARHGFKRGIETVNYVENVLDRYGRYHAIFELAAYSNEQGIGNFIGMRQ